jgi:glycosyltransferase involved in cell wall biosynthesis
MSIGEKRQRLVDVASGEYIAFVDDDDSVSPDYVEQILKAIRAHGADVITFRQEAWYCGKKAEVHFHSQHVHDEPFRPGAVIRRGPWHVCAWRKAAISECQFLHCNYGEDAAWVQQARQHIRRASHIDRVLHTYRHDPETTAAPEK